MFRCSEFVALQCDLIEFLFQFPYFYALRRYLLVEQGDGFDVTWCVFTIVWGNEVA